MLLLTLLALQTAAAPVAPAASMPPLHASTAAETSKDDRVECHTDTHTGSRLASRTCHTVREWRIMEDASAEWLRKQRPMPSASGGG